VIDLKGEQLNERKARSSLIALQRLDRAPGASVGGCDPRFGELWTFQSGGRAAKIRHGSLGNTLTVVLSTRCISPQEGQ
jgi:hypothetical protein